MRDRAIVTVAIGSEYRAIAELTHPTLRRYADRIGADFIVLDGLEISESVPQWEKFRIFSLLNAYRRILYLDSDLIVRDDCPDLFEVVPEDRVGVFNEAPFTERKGLVESMADSLGKRIKVPDAYYNSGVMVVSRRHKFLFWKPEEEVNNFYEQTYLNVRIAEERFEVAALGYKFNRMSCLDRYIGVSRLDSYIVHYAGCPSLFTMLGLVRKDLSGWKKDFPDYRYKQRVFVSVSGGLGDQIDAQPAIRFMRERVLPEAEICVATHYPRIFGNVDGIKVFMQGMFVAEADTAYCLVDSFPPPSSVTYGVVGNLLCHTVDYCSIALLKRTLPFAEKSIRLSFTLGDIQKVMDVVGLRDLRELVVIHAGKHWETKTMPREWWEAVIEGLVKYGVPVCLIGKVGAEDGAGVWDFGDKAGVINLVDLLDLDGLIALLSQAGVLVSNDSSPIHIAGAFDNWIIVIPSVKHPDHILPFRNGTVRYKTEALYKRMPLDDYSTSPFEIDEVAIAKMVDTWDKYLIEPAEVVEVVKERRGRV